MAFENVPVNRVLLTSQNSATEWISIKPLHNPTYTMTFVCPLFICLRQYRFSIQTISLYYRLHNSCCIIFCVKIRRQILINNESFNCLKVVLARSTTRTGICVQSSEGSEGRVRSVSRSIEIERGLGVAHSTSLALRHLLHATWLLERHLDYTFHPLDRITGWTVCGGSVLVTSVSRWSPGVPRYPH